MIKVMMESWREGLQKVALTKLQHEKLGLSLSESKRNVDMLLDDQVIILEIDDESVAREFQDNAEKIGVNCKLLS